MWWRRVEAIGWIELKEKEINDKAILNTARVIAAVNPDVLACVEVEDRPGLVRFNENVLAPIFEATDRPPYPFALVIDGNDAREIDVGILSRHPKQISARTYLTWPVHPRFSPATVPSISSKFREF